MDVLTSARLTPPPVRASTIVRTRLFAVMDRAIRREMTVVMAPAGSGKSLLVTSWLAARPDLVAAWVSLDAVDDSPHGFWSLIARAIDRVVPGVAEPVLRVLDLPTAPIRDAVDELLARLGRFNRELVVVLDDLHLISDESTLRLLAQLAERLPGNVRIVATSRAAPTGRLGRLRARASLSEVPAKQLAFTESEAAELLEAATGARVAVGDVSALVGNLEGWAAGLGLAALSLETGDISLAELLEVGGGHRHIAELLVAEVLDGCDDASREFLLDCAVFTRFNAAACAAVLGVDTAAGQLREISLRNLFLVPLDPRGDWYRYHHLLREVLHAELFRSSPTRARALHERAARWFEAEGLYVEALGHASASGDAKMEADLLDRHAQWYLNNDRGAVFLAGVDRISDEQLIARPMLAASTATVAFNAGHPAAYASRLLDLAELGTADLSDEALHNVSARIAYARSSVETRNLARAIAHARRAVSLARGYNRRIENLGQCLLALYLFFAGDLDEARRCNDYVLSYPELSEQRHVEIYTHATHALIETDSGRIRSAFGHAEHATQAVNRAGPAGSVLGGNAALALGYVRLHADQQREAEQDLEMAEHELRGSVPTFDHIFAIIMLARARIGTGKLALATTELALAREHLISCTDSGRLPTLADDVEHALANAMESRDGLITAPTPAELEVLRLLPSDLSLRDIGAELFLSINTVKTHAKNLYRKLGANDRQSAVIRARAEELI